MAAYNSQAYITPPSATAVNHHSALPNDSRLSQMSQATLNAVSGLTGASVGYGGRGPQHVQDFASRQAQQSLSASARTVQPMRVTGSGTRVYGIQQSSSDPATLKVSREQVLEPMPFPDVSGRFRSGVDTRHVVEPDLGMSAKGQINVDRTKGVFSGILFGNSLLRGGHQITAYKMAQVLKPDPEITPAPSIDVQQDAKTMPKEELLALTSRGERKAREILNERVWNQASQSENVDDIRFVKYNLIYKRPGGDVRAPLAARTFRQRSQHVSATEYGYKRREIRSQIFPGSARIRG